MREAQRQRRSHKSRKLKCDMPTAGYVNAFSRKDGDVRYAYGRLRQRKNI
ncbi:hypothetical protein [Floridanema aerugineum]|uniref:Uncharacterized protein n=1 Tax=Floridaenema aerugineum BLCC-F46 TaxID=3153654 RepID=A0ABV4WZM4_9CYAN